MKVSQTLQAGYDEQYTDEIREWRELGAKYKVDNILSLCGDLELDSALDCGAGDGSVLKFLDESGRFDELHAVEISDSGVKQIERRKLPKVVEAVKFDGYELPYGDDKFDLAIATHVIEHVEHPRILLRELKRVSKYQVLEVPLDFRVRVDDGVSGALAIGHINIYTPSLFRFLVKSEGFEIIDQRLTSLSPDVVRYNWYKNEKRSFNVIDEAKLMLAPLRAAINRVVVGKARHEEFAYDALTILTRSAGELSIM